MSYQNKKRDFDNLSRFSSRARSVLVIAVFFLVLCVGFDLHTRGMLSPEQGLTYEADYDEGVYVAAGQLWLQGFVPYRDYLYVQPPLSVYLFGTILRLHTVSWGDGIAFMLVRYASIAFGLVTLIAVFLIARKLGGTASGLVALGVLALDAQVIEINRRAMLEPSMNALSALAVLSYLYALDVKKYSRLLFVFAGSLGTCAMLVKLVGGLVLGVLFTYATGRVIRAPAHARKPRIAELVALVVGVAATAAMILTPPIFNALATFVRQVVIFQIIRPAYWYPTRLERIAEILKDGGSALTVALAMVGIGIIFMGHIARQGSRRWLVIMMWAALVSAFLMYSRTFYLHYYIQLAVPFSILAGAVVSQGQRAAGIRWMSFLRVAQAGLLVLVASIIIALLPREFAQAQAVATFRSVRLVEVRDYLINHTPRDAKVAAHDPSYWFVASREPPRLSNGTVLIDIFGYLWYAVIGVERERYPDASVQEELVDWFNRADYGVIESRALSALTPESLADIYNNFRVIYHSTNTEIVERRK